MEFNGSYCGFVFIVWLLQWLIVIVSGCWVQWFNLGFIENELGLSECMRWDFKCVKWERMNVNSCEVVDEFMWMREWGMCELLVCGNLKLSLLWTLLWFHVFCCMEKLNVVCTWMYRWCDHVIFLVFFSKVLAFMVCRMNVNYI